MFQAQGSGVDFTTSIAPYAVFGHPVAHSKSPAIHRAFAHQSHLSIDYRAIDATAQAFPEALAAFAAAGGRGANITLPLKSLAYARAESIGEAARRTGVVNTLTRTATGWRGDNTDGLGLVADVTGRWRLDLRGRRALILGAGGAVAGVLYDLIASGVERIVIANRSPERAESLADRFGDPGRVGTVYWDDLASLGEFALVLNGTAAGHNGIKLDLPMGLAAPRALAYDMNYGNAAIDFLAWGRAAGFSHVHDGLGMLIEQAAEAFAIWHGVRPDTGSVFESLRDAPH